MTDCSAPNAVDDDATTCCCLPCGRPRAAPPCPPPDPWLAAVLAIMCPADRDFLTALRNRGVTVTAFDRIYFDDPYYDGANWITRRFEAGGSTLGTHINMIRDPVAATNAATIYHEGVHTGQPAAMAWRDKEYEAYTLEEAWRETHGVPSHQADFRNVDALGHASPNVAAIRAFVDTNYPGVAVAGAGGAPEQVIDRTAGGNTILQRADGTTYNRPPVLGDAYPGPEVTQPPGGAPVLTCQLNCPP